MGSFALRLYGWIAGVVTAVVSYASLLSIELVSFLGAFPKKVVAMVHEFKGVSRTLNFLALLYTLYIQFVYYLLFITFA